jgi:hypothetical protein
MRLIARRRSPIKLATGQLAPPPIRSGSSLLILAANLPAAAVGLILSLPPLPRANAARTDGGEIDPGAGPLGSGAS